MAMDATFNFWKIVVGRKAESQKRFLQMKNTKGETG